MWLKVLLGGLFLLSLLGAFVLSPHRGVSQSSESLRKVHEGKRLRLLTWNIGNGDLESETRAHTEDLPAVSKVIRENAPDAIALQELTGEDQLKLLLSQLENHYRGFICSRGGADRVDALLIKDVGDRQDFEVFFDSIKAGDWFAAAAKFRFSAIFPQIVLVSAHADAFSASRRRAFTENVVDWTRNQRIDLVFLAGDFNFEVSTRNRSNLFTDDAKHDSESYAYLLKYFRDLGRDAGATSVNDRRIDYVFGPPAAVSLVHAEVLRGSAVGRMDHWPVLVEVGL
jgi:endonuclease/exonuclease/phosphatase family metal-dependent hydrolase